MPLIQGIADCLANKTFRRNLLNDAKQQEFISFILEHYVSQGVEELDRSKMTSLLELKYETISDAVKELDGIPKIREVFIGFQEHLLSAYDGIVSDYFFHGGIRSPSLYFRPPTGENG